MPWRAECYECGQDAGSLDRLCSAELVTAADRGRGSLAVTGRTRAPRQSVRKLLPRLLPRDRSIAGFLWAICRSAGETPRAPRSCASSVICRWWPQPATPDVDEMVLPASGPSHRVGAKLAGLQTGPRIDASIGNLTVCHKQRVGDARKPRPPWFRPLLTLVALKS